MMEYYSSKHRKIAVDFFLDIYLNEPFNYEWLKREQAARYLKDMENTPNFRGFVYIENGKTIAFCCGLMNDYFIKKTYYIKEFFVKREFQKMGYGKKFLAEIERKLIEDNVSIMELVTDRKCFSYDFYSQNSFLTSKDMLYMIKPIQ